MVARFSTIKDCKNTSPERRHKRNEQSMKNAHEESEVKFCLSFSEVAVVDLAKPVPQLSF
jgi:hypothetical protein